MSELFEDEEEKILVEDEFEEAQDIVPDNRNRSVSDARRRLENLLDEKRLRDELEDFFDY